MSRLQRFAPFAFLALCAFADSAGADASTVRASTVRSSPVRTNQDESERSPDAEAQLDPAVRRAIEAEQRLAEITERFELGLLGECLELGEPAVAEGGLLEGRGEALAIVARALFAAGREADAQALLDEAQPTPATAPWVELEKARLWLELDELDRARTALQAPRGSDQPVRHPELAESYLLLSRVYARAGRLDLGAQLARTFLERAPLSPEAPAAWHLLSRDAAQRGDGQAAGQFLAKSRELKQWHEVYKARRLQRRLNPEDPLPWYGIGLAWLQVEQWQRGAAELRALLTAHPDFGRAWFPLGEALRNAGDPQGALEAYGNAIEADATDPKPRLNRGLLHLQLDDVDRARADLEPLLGTDAADDPTYASLHLALARAWQRAGEPDELVQSAYAKYRELGGTEAL
jgi:tetratricopeptide (TPR) repeat protein